MNELVSRIDNFLLKQEKVYIQPGEQPPDNAAVFDGERGGKYYFAQHQEKSPHLDSKKDQAKLKKVMLEYAPALADDYKQFVINSFNFMAKDIGPNLDGIYNANDPKARKWRETFYAIRHNLHQPTAFTARHGEKHPYEISKTILEKNAKQYGEEMATQWHNKLLRKLGDIEDIEISNPSGSYFTLTATKNGHKISVYQQRILKMSSKGLLFHQFPARIYVDGKFISESKFQGEHQVVKPEKKPSIDPNSRPREFYFRFKVRRDDGDTYETRDPAKGMTEEEARKKAGRLYGNRVVSSEVDTIYTWNGLPIWRASSGQPKPKDGIIEDLDAFKEKIKSRYKK